jgi:putative ABC transport system ATP-binding protein
MAGHDPITAVAGGRGAETPVRLCFRARGVTRVYNSGPAEVQALRGVDLDLPEGEMVVVLGASGSGKSTFLNILGGLDTPTGGEVLFRGADISRSDQHQLTEYCRRHVGSIYRR